VTYFHEEQRFGRWVWVVIAVIAVPVLIGALGAGQSGSGSVVAILVAPATIVAVLVLLALAKLVTDVDERGIHVSFHLLWPTRHIPFADVQRAHATAYSPLVDYGGWGVRLSWKGWAFNTGGAEGVLVETKSGKRIMIGSRRAKELEAAIAKASAAPSA
jgi:hypothetical protein